MKWKNLVAEIEWFSDNEDALIDAVMQGFPSGTVSGTKVNAQFMELDLVIPLTEGLKSNELKELVVENVDRAARRNKCDARIRFTVEDAISYQYDDSQEEGSNEMIGLRRYEGDNE